MEKRISSFLKNIKSKIIELQKKKINEAQTINYLIRPFFESLGWDFSNPNEVIPEDSDLSGKRPDFSFYINGEPKLLVEAKQLNNPLNDEKMITEKVNYCLSTNISFLIITNGDLYRIYYSELKGASKDKLLNQFCLSDDDEYEIIYRLSKIAFEQNELLSYSKNIFIYNNIKLAIQNLFVSPNTKIINIINEQIKEDMGHKFGNDEVSEALKQFTVELSSDLSEIMEDTNKDISDDDVMTWTVENQFKDGRWKETAKLYKSFISLAKSSGYEITEKPTKRYIGLVNPSDNNFCQINGQKEKLRTWFKLEMNDLTEEEQLKIRDVTNIGHWGMGNIEFIIKNSSDFDIALSLLKKAYNKK